VTTNAERLWSCALALAGALAGLGLFHLSAPSYLLHRGFPLDDAWIHAVYAREFARSLTLAYNPGIAATGETAPLWPVLLAPIHRLATGVDTIVIATKIAGFAVHAIACLSLALTLGGVMPDRRLFAAAVGALVGFHPHLVAASVSGMEVPLAELVVAGVLWAAMWRRRSTLFVIAALAIGARPEVAVIAVLLPLLLWCGDDRRESALLGGCAFAGATAALVGLGVRSMLITGMPLPATFYAKANRTSPFNTGLQQMGFSELLGRITLLDSATVLAGLFVLAWIVFPRASHRDDDRRVARPAVALFLSGMAFCAVSFALIPPVDPPAFYHQRYVLPGVMPAIAAIPLLAHAALRRFASKFATASSFALLIALAVICAAAAPPRARHLSNDAQNIDDVQVAFGRALAAEPPARIVWVVDAGAIRYFGRPFVVDMIGLNSPEILGDGAQAYLDAHPPSFLDVFPGWSRLETDVHVQMPARTFEAQTPYTVTSSSSMRAHVLVTCEPAGLRGRFLVRGKTRGFRCSS
jgi:hypothetical protein